MTLPPDMTHGVWPTLPPFTRLRILLLRRRGFAGQLRGAYGRPIPASVIRSIIDQPQSADAFSIKSRRRATREMVERQGDWIFNDEAYLCQTNEGDCT